MSINSGCDQISVLIAEDQTIVKLGLKLVLSKYDDIKIVGEAENGQVACELVHSLKPNVVIMDVGMPVMDGIKATQQIKLDCPNVKILVLTTHERDDDVFAALAAGADGYCLKDAEPDALVSALRSVRCGALWLDPTIADCVLRASLHLRAANSKSLAPSSNNIVKTPDAFRLSEREFEVLRLLVDGMSNQQMANHLYVSSETIKTHMRHLMEKLAVADRTQVAVKALREGLL